MFAAAGRIPRTGIQHHRADVLEGAPAELAGEVAVNPPLVGFVVLSMRIPQAIVFNQVAKISFCVSAMDAEERPFLVALEQGMLAPAVRMLCAPARQQRPRIVALLTAVFAVFAHRLPPYRYFLTVFRLTFNADAAFVRF